MLNNQRLFVSNVDNLLAAIEKQTGQEVEQVPEDSGMVFMGLQVFIDKNLPENIAELRSKDGLERVRMKLD